MARYKAAIKKPPVAKKFSNGIKLKIARISLLREKAGQFILKYPKAGEEFKLIKNIYLYGEAEIESLKKKTKDPEINALIEHLDGQRKKVIKKADAFIDSEFTADIKFIDVANSAINYKKEKDQIFSILFLKSTRPVEYYASKSHMRY